MDSNMIDAKRCGHPANRDPYPFNLSGKLDIPVTSASIFEPNQPGNVNDSMIEAFLILMVHSNCTDTKETLKLLELKNL
jgi:hypothetical protein